MDNRRGGETEIRQCRKDLNYQRTKNHCVVQYLKVTLHLTHAKTYTVLFLQLLLQQFVYLW